MGTTGISYLDKTWNVVTGCTPAGAGCASCWARELHDQRHAAHKRGAKLPDQYATPFSTVVCHEDRLTEPLKWKKSQRVGVAFTGDLFHDVVPESFLFRVLDVVNETMRHTYMVTTKRPENARHRLRDLTPAMLRNLWVGASVWDQPSYDFSMFHMRALAAVGWNTWLSIEPMLGAIQLGPDPVKIIIIGGENTRPKAKARPCNVEWIRSLIHRCDADGVRVYLKQLGSRPYDGAWHQKAYKRPARQDCEIKSATLCLRNPAGADPSEWPEDLRKYCEWPEVTP